MKFLVTVTPRRQQVPPVTALEASKAWIDAKLADKTFDCSYAFVTGGGVGICNAGSADALNQLIFSYPGYPFVDFKIEPLCDIHLALDQVIAMLRGAGH
ncbi:MAG: hypothetical protein ACLQU1_10420 [Bryobacteraceae bacterium]